MITPRSGNTFGWRRDFQVMTSLQNLYKRCNQFVNTVCKDRLRAEALTIDQRSLTFVMASKLRSRGRKALMATSFPRHLRFKTSADPQRYCTSPIVFPGNSKCSDLGSRVRLAHILYKHFTHLVRIFGEKLTLSSACPERLAMKLSPGSRMVSHAPGQLHR